MFNMSVYPHGSFPYEPTDHRPQFFHLPSGHSGIYHISQGSTTAQETRSLPTTTPGPGDKESSHYNHRPGDKESSYYNPRS